MAEPRGIFKSQFLSGRREESDKIRILVVDDHKLVRQGIVKLLEVKGDLLVVGEAGDGHEALSKADSLKPDVVLMDISMPEMNGIEATERIRTRFQSIHVIAMSLYDSRDMAETMYRAGASAYLCKSESIGQIFKTIRQVVQEN